MKVTLTTLLFSALLLVGCADEPLSPLESDNHSYQLIKLPPRSGLSVETQFSATKTIDGDKGGTIKLKKSYIAEDGRRVKIDVKLKVKKHSFTGNVDITMTVDNVYAAIWFTPHMVFDKPVELKAKFEGIDLEELSLTTGYYDFVYIQNNGDIELVEHDQIDVDEKKGKIKFHGKKGKAKLNHFSRYAFIK
jgi:hypothetical protein